MCLFNRNTANVSKYNIQLQLQVNMQDYGSRKIIAAIVGVELMLDDNMVRHTLYIVHRLTVDTVTTFVISLAVLVL